MSYARTVGTLTSGQVSVDCFASVLASALASSKSSVAESAGTVSAAVEAVLDGVGVPSGTGGEEDVLVSMRMLSSARAPPSWVLGTEVALWARSRCSSRATRSAMVADCASLERVVSESWAMVLRSFLESVSAAAWEQWHHPPRRAALRAVVRAM
jgi:hypothetical protein